MATSDEHYFIIANLVFVTKIVSYVRVMSPLSNAKLS